MHHLAYLAIRRTCMVFGFFFSSRRRHTRLVSDWSSDVCSSDLFFGEISTKAAGGAATSVTSHDNRAADLPLAKKIPALIRSSRVYLVRYYLSPLPEIGRASCRERGQIAGGPVRKARKEHEQTVG